ncbi:MAG TPA: DUF1275 domain-containing protein [Epulopiscium sp.]|nr:DUF1275 domain-containing protein [Candidatus Epulonipiscium sp.]
MNKLGIKFFTPINLIGFVLVVMAGWIDTISLMIFLDKRTSSMTGRAAKLGLLIFNRDTMAVDFVLLIILSFIVGACISTLITRKTGLTGGLSFTSLMLVVTTFTSLKTGMHLSVISIPMAMGGLNAATSLTAIDRTTHLTGASTDIGINLAKGNWNGVVFWSLRWIGFVLGTLISLKVIQLYNATIISRSFLLLLPATVIILTGIIQKLTIDVPLLEDAAKRGTAPTLP